MGGGWAAVAVFLVGYNLIRAATAVWALRTGLETGMQVGAAISRSWVPRWIPLVGAAAGFLIGAAVPLVGGWYLDRIGTVATLGTVAVAGTGVAVTRWFGPALTTVRFTLLAMGLLAFFRWVGA
jgi:hypothetical protein